MVFGLALSVASTVVLLRTLEARGMLMSMNGQIAVGWLIVEGLAMVLVLVLLPAFAGMLGKTGIADANLLMTLSAHPFHRSAAAHAQRRRIAHAAQGRHRHRFLRRGRTREGDERICA